MVLPLLSPRPARRDGSFLLLVGLTVMLSASCGAGDPHARVLKERARWNVELPSGWIQHDDGSIYLTARLSGPPNFELTELTVGFDLFDGADQRIGRHWHTFDLSRVPRGLTKEFEVRVPPVGQPVEGLAVAMVLDPDEEEASQLRELEP